MLAFYRTIGIVVSGLISIGLIWLVPFDSIGKIVALFAVIMATVYLFEKLAQSKATLEERKADLRDRVDNQPL